jgi:hypothetical protein
MHSPESLQIAPSIIMPNDSAQVRDLKQKLNEVIQKFEEAYRYLHMDVRIRDFREMPPHPSISHSRWKFVENPTTGDLELYHRTGGVWAPSGWAVEGDMTYP